MSLSPLIDVSLPSFHLTNILTSYGVEFPKQLNLKPPFYENSPRIPDPFRSKISYYTQYGRLTELSANKPWTYIEIRPDGVVGSAPSSNAMNMSQGTAIYLSLIGACTARRQSPLPGLRARVQDDAHGHVPGRALPPRDLHRRVHGRLRRWSRVQRPADGPVITWADVWPRLCAHWGLKDGGPQPEAQPIAEFVKQSRGVCRELCAQYGFKESLVDEQGWGHLHFMIVQFDVHREVDLADSRKVGFNESIDTVEGYFIAWRRMTEAGPIPPVEASIGKCTSGS